MKFKLISKKASSEILAILIAIAVIGSASFAVYSKMNKTYRGSRNAIDTRISSQMGQFSNGP